MKWLGTLIICLMTQLAVADDQYFFCFNHSWTSPDNGNVSRLLFFLVKENVDLNDGVGAYASFFGTTKMDMDECRRFFQEDFDEMSDEDQADLDNYDMCFPVDTLFQSDVPPGRYRVWLMVQDCFGKWSSPVVGNEVFIIE